MYLHISSISLEGSYKEKFKYEKITTDDKGVIYKYIDENNNNTEINIKDGEVLVNRKGEVNYLQTLKPMQITKFTYNTPFFSSEMEIYTEYLKYDNTSLKLKYIIYNCGNIINKIEFTLQERGN